MSAKLSPEALAKLTQRFSVLYCLTVACVSSFLLELCLFKKWDTKFKSQTENLSARLNSSERCHWSKSTMKQKKKFHPNFLFTSQYF